MSIRNAFGTLSRCAALMKAMPPAFCALGSEYVQTFDCATKLFAGSWKSACGFKSSPIAFFSDSVNGAEFGSQPFGTVTMMWYSKKSGPFCLKMILFGQRCGQLP